MWSPEINYPLSVTSFTHIQWSALQKAYNGIFLSNIGIARTNSHDIIFGPYLYNGFNISELLVRQSTCHLQYLLSYLCASDNVGALLTSTTPITGTVATKKR